MGNLALPFSGAIATDADEFTVRNNLQPDQSGADTSRISAMVGHSEAVGHGVHGITGNSSGRTPPAPAGVWGESDNGFGVYAVATKSGGSYGFIGGTTDGPHFTNHTGVFGESDGLGVYGSTTGVNGTGVYGNGGPNGFAVRGDSSHSNGFIAGTTDTPHFATHAGVFGESDNMGVYGSTTGVAGTGVYGNGGTSGFGVRADCVNGAAIQGHSFGSGLAGQFIGDVEVTGDIRLKNADCAEDFDISGSGAVEPGTVMVIDQCGSLRISESAFDKRVAGVVSGAGDFKPGLILDRQHSGEKRRPIALVGKVYCKVDAQYGPIQVGDLLTTSPTAGHAMKTMDALNAFGSVIGKALRPLESGQGLIPILIALQ